MKFVDKIPTKAVIVNCEKHGDYEIKYMNTGKRFLMIDYCTTCNSEAEAKRIIDDEIAKANTDKENAFKLRESNRTRSGISKRNLYKTFDDYICTNEGQVKAKNDCIRYAENFPTDKSMIMVGGVGTGKTLLACAILDCLVDKHDCGIIKLIDIVRRVKSTWSKDSNETEEDVINLYVKADLLIIDEVGSQFGSDTEKLFIFDIIDGRYQDMKPTILISNLDIHGVKESIGERCVDRLREGGGMMIAFDWKSSRN